MKARVATLLIVLVLFGCRQRETRTTSTSESANRAAAETPQEGGTLIRRLRSDINTLNMAQLTTESEKTVLQLVHDPLIDVDERIRFIPGLAREWEVSPDGRAYTFHLDPRANFSDGTPVKASDVLFTLRKIVDPASESVTFAGLFEGLDLKQTVVLNEKSIRIVFNRGRASQLAAFSIGILPEHIYGKGNFKNDFGGTAVGTGPYRVVRREPGSEIVLQRRENYWRKPPYIDRIIFKVIPDDTVAWNGLKRTDLDEGRISSDQWKMEGMRPDVQKNLDIRRFYTLDYNFVAWNNRHPLLGDKNIRKALAMCLDRRAIINNVYFGTARIITGPFTPDQWAYNPDVPAIEFNPAEARRVFAAAGWSDTNGDGWLDKNRKNFELDVLLAAGSKTSELQAQIFHDALKKIGVKMNLKKVEGSTWAEDVFSGNYTVTFGAWGQDLDPDVYTILHSSQFPPAGQNFVFYSNPEADRLIEAGRQEFDSEKRKEIYHRLHAIVADDQPFTWTVQPSAKWAVNRRIRNVREAPGLGLFLWYPGQYQWWIPLDQRTHDRPARPATPASR